jgi:hypothetical protein
MSSQFPFGIQQSQQEQVHPGTRVVLDWARWLKEKGFPVARQISVFRKGDQRINVHRYPRGVCVLITQCATAPKMRKFQEWRQPFSTVRRELEKSGWEFQLPEKRVNGHDRQH